MTELSGRPIGPVSSERTEPLDDGWDNVRATITLDAEQFGPEALRDSMRSRTSRSSPCSTGSTPTGCRPSHGTPAATRTGRRWGSSLSERRAANRLGVSVYRLLAVQDLTASVHALDAIDGTPILDLTPYVAEFAPPGQLHQPARSRELMAAYSIQRNHLRLLTSTPSRLAWSTCAVKSRTASGRASGASRAT